MTGLIEKEIVDEAIGALALEDLKPVFVDDDVRTVQLLSVPLADATITLPHTYQFVGLDTAGHRAWFLRASKSASEREQGAVDTAVQTLMTQNDTREQLDVEGTVGAAEALFAAQEEVEDE